MSSDVSSLGNTPSWYHTPTNSSQITTSPAQPSLIAPPQRVSAQARNPASASAPAPAAGSLHPPAALKLTSDDIVSAEGPSRLQPVSAFALSNPPALPSRRYAMPKPVPAPVPVPAPAAIPLPSHAARTSKRPSPPADTVAGPAEKRGRVDEQGTTGTTGKTGTTVQLEPSAKGWTARPPSPPAGRHLLPNSESSGGAGTSQRSAGINSSDPGYGIPAIDTSADRANSSRDVELDAQLLPEATEKRDPDPASRRSEAETRARQEAQERAEAETVQRSREAADAERLKRGFTSGVSPSIHLSRPISSHLVQYRWRRRVPTPIGVLRTRS